MSASTYLPDYTLFNTFYISNIIFDDSDGVTVCGYADVEGESRYINLFCNFQQLDAILSVKSKKESKKIIDAITDRLCSGFQDTPEVIDVNELAGQYLCIDGCHFIVYEPDMRVDHLYGDGSDELDLSEEIEEEPEEDELENVTCYMLDQLLITRQVAVLKKDETITPEIYPELNQLYAIYQIYLQVIECGYTDNQARKMLKLDNPILFRMLEQLHQKQKPK